MDISVAEWLSLALRWFHLVAGIAWIGSSFYFIWLDNHLRAVKTSKEGVAGELWAVHGGGFYHKQKYLVAPADMPDELHWFKWEAYTTWITGFLLLCLIYYYGANLFLIDRAKVDFSPASAIAVGLGFLVAGWLCYDGLCRSPLGAKPMVFGLVWYLVLVAAAFALTHLFSNRGAFMHVGAIIGTVMAANVFLVIIPNQKKVVADLVAGRSPDARLGLAAKQRSLHNNYMTLPVLLIMISNHYPILFANPLNWLVLAWLGAVGWAIRHFFNLRHTGREDYRYLIFPALAFVLLMFFAADMKHRAAPRPQSAAAVSFTEVQGLLKIHCVACHSAHPTHEGFAEAPNGAQFERREDVERYAAKIYEQAVASEAMPLGNETHMTPEERARLGRWIAAQGKTGAPTP